MKPRKSVPISLKIVLWIAGLLLTFVAGCSVAAGPAPSDGEPASPQVEAPASAPTLVPPTSEPEPTATPVLPPVSPLTETPGPPTNTSEPAATAGPTETPMSVARAVVIADPLNVRAGPGTNYNVIGQVEVGDPLTVHGRNARGDWLLVTLADGTEGWVAAQFTSYSFDLNTIPVAQTIPAAPAAAPTQVVQAPPASNDPPPAMPAPLPAGAVPGTNPLTGLATNQTALARRPVLVRVGNDPVARAIQAGLSQADVVYEEIMDGWGVTRYTAVFWSQDAPVVRPVRSARLLSIDLAKQYQSALAHSGASDPIRQRLAQAPIIDLDEFFHRQPYTYGAGDWRTRLFTTVPAVRSYLKARGLDQPVGLEAWAYSDQPPGGSSASTITIAYPNGTVVWQWDAGIGRYRRFIGRAADVDANTGQQITAANVIMLYAVHAKTDIVEDSLGSTAIDIQLRGSGTVKIARDGVVIDGTWQRTNEFQPTRFSVPLKPGNSWVEIIPSGVEQYYPKIQ